MNVLHKTFEPLGFVRVATFLGSGNVVFETRAKDIGALERKIERALQEALGYTVPVFIRTHTELKEIASLEPSKMQRPEAQISISSCLRTSSRGG